MHAARTHAHTPHRRAAAELQGQAQQRLGASLAAMSADAVALADAADARREQHMQSLLRLREQVDGVRTRMAKQAERNRCVGLLHMLAPTLSWSW
jgi:hypothetical protein